MKKVELLAPAGNLEKLKMAVLYGADAVYLGGEEYGLRASSDNFSYEEMREAIQFAHSRGKKVYLTINIIPHNEDINKLPQYLREISHIGFDAVIVSDPGIFTLVKEILPEMDIHISTQANNTNWMSAKFWFNQGAKRIVLARELSQTEIEEIRYKAPNQLELEMFVHGAMCISYSGRCLLSNYMANRDSNRGNCAHPCRWKYNLVEEKRPGEFIPVYENERGTFIFNSKDLCLLEHIPEIIKSGVASLKIEGRMKSSYYVATVVSGYRQAIDKYYENPDKYKFNTDWIAQISKASHREYTTGFFKNKPNENDQQYNTSSYIREYDFIGIVLEYDRKNKIAKIEQRNRFYVGDELEIFNANGEYFMQKIAYLKNELQEDIEVAQHPQMIVYTQFDQDVEQFSILRRK